jgi:DeoR/GlpR family transcriptional regulator of sugar metabolism/energy-coupling factor transporter ATP-binding protein EcfA2
VRVTDLAERFAVSEVTIRKDLRVLETEGRVVRAHGGALAPSRSRPSALSSPRAPPARREGAHRSGRCGAGGRRRKHRPGREHDGAFHGPAPEGPRPWVHLTVITNGLRIASELAGSRGITVALPGGFVRWEAMSVVGPLGGGLLERVNIQKAFMGAAGFTLETGLSDATDEEAQIKRLIVASASEVVGLVDHTKWGRAAFATFCPTDRLTGVVTDQEAPAEMVAELRRRQVAVHVLQAWRRRPRPASGGPPDRPRWRACRERAATDRRRECRNQRYTRVCRRPECAPAGRAGRRIEAVRRHPGPLGRLAGSTAGRDPWARRRERRRARARSSRCWPASTSPIRARLARRQAGAAPRTRPCALARHRRGPPGAAPVPRPDGRRERLHGPRPTGRFGSVNWREMRRSADRIFESLSVHMDSAAVVRGLSMADQQLIEIAKALSVEARVLVLDEPTASLSGARGRAALRHRPPDARPRRGGPVRQPPPRRSVRAVRSRDRPARRAPRHHRPDVRAHGRRTSFATWSAAPCRCSRGSAAEIGDVLLDVRNLTRIGAFRDISFSVRSGEIVGLAGLVGAGRTEVARVLFGLDRADKGEVLARRQAGQLQDPVGGAEGRHRLRARRPASGRPGRGFLDRRERDPADHPAPLSAPVHESSRERKLAAGYASGCGSARPAWTS